MEIDETVLKLLISGTKRNILKSLGKRRKILTELSRELRLSMPTLLEHLNSLSKANLVIKCEEGRKWKYYELTGKGKNVVNPSEPLKLALVFTIPAILIMAGLLTSSPIVVERNILKTITYQAEERVSSDVMAASGAEAETTSASLPSEETTEDVKTYGDEEQLLSKGLILSGIVLLAILLLFYIRSRPNLGKLFK